MNEKALLLSSSWVQCHSAIVYHSVNSDKWQWIVNNKYLICVINICEKLGDELIIANVLFVLENQVFGDSRRCNLKILLFKENSSLKNCRDRIKKIRMFELKIVFKVFLYGRLLKIQNISSVWLFDGWKAYDLQR